MWSVRSSQWPWCLILLFNTMMRPTSVSTVTGRMTCRMAELFISDLSVTRLMGVRATGMIS